MLSVKYTQKKFKKKINATWQRYIKSLCAVIFLFYFCLGCRESLSKAQRGAELERTMWEPGRRENGTCCLFSAASSLTFFIFLTDHFTCQHHPSDQTGYGEPSAHPVDFSLTEPWWSTKPRTWNLSSSGMSAEGQHLINASKNYFGHYLNTLPNNKSCRKKLILNLYFFGRCELSECRLLLWNLHLADHFIYVFIYSFIYVLKKKQARKVFVSCSLPTMDMKMVHCKIIGAL